MIVYRRARSVAWGFVTRRRLKKLQAARAARATGEPEFADLLEARGDWLFRTLPRASAEYIYDLHPKDKQKLMAKRLGISVAEEYVTHVPLAEALAYMESSFLDAFVLKPNAGKSGAGVFCLLREAGGYRDLKSGKLRSPARLRELANESYGRLRRADAWLVEELLLSPDDGRQPAGDYKFFCFAGRVELIFQKGEVGAGKRRRQAVRFYDRDLTPVDTGLRPEAVSDELELPPTIHTMVAEAERVSAPITTPFMRVDLYDSHRGIVLGELTPGPGRMYQLNDQWKERLTRRWHEASAVLEGALLAGEVEPLMPEEPERELAVAGRTVARI